MNLLKAVFVGFLTRTKRIINEKRAEIKVSDLPPFKIAEVVIGGTTYLVSSFFKKDANYSVVDKVRRMIEREAESTPEK